MSIAVLEAYQMFCIFCQIILCVETMHFQYSVSFNTLFSYSVSYNTMAKITGVFSMRHFFVLSLALNVSFILRTMYEREQGLICFRSETQKGQTTQRRELSISTSKFKSVFVFSLIYLPPLHVMLSVAQKGKKKKKQELVNMICFCVS
jgi:hypothetical protein